MISRAIFLAASLFAVSTPGVLAQSTQNNTAGTGGLVAKPTYSSGAVNAHDPALSQKPISQTTNVPPDKNPRVRGATGRTVVLGSKSSVSKDRPTTLGAKTGPASGSKGDNSE